jgi:hypothetical protein
MGTVREYFDTDIKHGGLLRILPVEKEDMSLSSSLTSKIAWDLDGNAKYWSFFMPSDLPAECFQLIFDHPETASCTTKQQVTMEMGWPGYSEKSSSNTLVFTKRIFIYIDHLLTPTIRSQMTDIGLKKGYHVEVRDQEYAILRSQQEKPLAFISHDSRDKDELVRGLAKELSSQMCPVWYDEYSLKVGDNLREKIEKGLKETEKCIVILSPNFLTNRGWGKAEFDSIFTREILEKKNVILPIWHNVGVQEIYDYSPGLANKVALNSSMGAVQLAAKLANAIRRPEA